jgi:hypothetical protein
MSEELESAHALAVQNVFGGHRLAAAQSIPALQAAGSRQRVTSGYSKSWKRRLRLLEEDDRKLRPAHERAADLSAKLWISTSHHVKSRGGETCRRCFCDFRRRRFIRRRCRRR